MCSTVSRAAAIRAEQARDPLGAYGRTKAAGEEAVEQVLGDTGRCSETTPYDPRSSYSAKPHARQTRTRLQ